MENGRIPAGLEQFQAMCAEATAFYISNPHTRYETRIFLHGNGTLDSETAIRGESFAPHVVGDITFPICSFNSLFPHGLGFLLQSGMDLKAAFYNALNLRVRFYREHADHSRPQTGAPA